MPTTVSISDYVNGKLGCIKDRDGHTSKDSVIRTLLLKDVGTTVNCGNIGCLKNFNGKCKETEITIENGICKNVDIQKVFRFT